MPERKAIFGSDYFNRAERLWQGQAFPELVLFDYDYQPSLKKCVRQVDSKTLEVTIGGKIALYEFVCFSPCRDWICKLKVPAINIDAWQRMVAAMPDAKTAGSRRWDKRRSYRHKK
jgi:hypothetical protein